MTPLRRYHPNGSWEVVPHAMASPAPDGSVAYYQDSLSPGPGAAVALFDDLLGRKLCQYLTALTIRKGVPITDGPYLQLLEDDGAVPPGWQMLRALIWCDEFDLLTPMEASDISDAGIEAADVSSLSQYRIRSMNDPDHPDDHWVAVQHTPCEAFVFGDKPDDPDHLDADLLGRLAASHVCKPKDVGWVRSQPRPSQGVV